MIIIAKRRQKESDASNVRSMVLWRPVTGNAIKNLSKVIVDIVTKEKRGA
jgi:hypothetical protein